MSFVHCLRDWATDNKNAVLKARLGVQKGNSLLASDVDMALIKR